MATYTIPTKDYIDSQDALKAPLDSPTFTGTVSGITKSQVGLGNVDTTSDVNKPISTATATAIANTVKLTGNQTVAGVKTFSSSPVIPNATATGQAVASNQLGGRRNYLINGNFDMWQRGTSQTSIGYGSADRWFINFNGNCTLAYEQVSYNNTARLSWTIAGTYINFLSSVEDGARKLQGKTATMSFMAKAATAGTCSTYIGRGVTVDNAFQLDIAYINLTTSWQKITRTFTVPTYDNSKSVLVVGLAHMQLLGDSNTVWIKEVKLEDGSVATDGWHPYDGEFGGEVQACQRYYEEVKNLYFSSPYTPPSGAPQMLAYWAFKVNKRVSTGTLESSVPIINTSNDGCGIRCQRATDPAIDILTFANLKYSCEL